MQRVLSVKFSGEGRFILSGSEDTNIRIWKTTANEKLGLVDGREKRAMDYRRSLAERYQHVEEVGRIKNHRHVPKWIKNEGKRRSDKFESRKIAESNKAMVSGNDVVHPLRKAVIREMQ